jgi:hypothetical protein
MTADGVSPARLLHLAMAALVATAALGVWPAAERVSAVAHAQAVALGGVAYVGCWAIARQRAWRAAALGVVLLVSTLCAAYFILQYRHLAEPEAKVAMLDAVGRALSRPFPRLGSWTPFANSLATLLEGTVAVAVGLVLARGAAATRAWAAVAAAVLLTACVVSASRGSWLAVAASLALFAAPARLLRLLPLAAALAGVVVLAVLASAVGGGTPWWMRVAGLAGRPDRLDVYLQALTLVRDLPFTGLGAGDQFSAAVSKYVLLIQVPFITYAHNLTLQLWLAWGLAGLGAWWALAAATVVAAAAGESAGLGRRFRGVWAGLVAIHLHGLSDARQFVDLWTWAPFFVLAGLLAGYVSRSECRLSRRVAWAPLAVAAATALAVVVGRGDPLAAWQANLGALAQGRADHRVASGSNGAGERAAAAARFERALVFDPDDGPALRRLGMLALDAGQHADATRWLARAWAVEPSHAPTRKAYGLAAVWNGDTALAAQLLAPVPGMADELTTYSRWRHQRGEIPLAVAAARASLAIAPDQPEVAGWLAQLAREAVPPVR